MNPHSLEIELAEAAQRHPTRVLSRTWGEFVARWQWEWFVTHTFTEDTHPERALKLYYVWCSKLSRVLYGRNWHKKEPFGVTWIVAVEFQKSGRVHLHALLSGVWDTRRLEWMDNWYVLDTIAGFSRIEPVDNQEAASRYVSKYVAKGGELHFSKNLRIRSRDLFDLPSETESET
jgi:hypothetical protein